MRKIITVFTLVFFTLSSLQAQDKEDKKDHWERIKALKVAFITQEFDMSTELAQSFWPIYNDYESERRKLHKREHFNLDNVEAISETRAEEMLEEYLTVEREEYIIKKKLFSDLRQILSAKDIIKLRKLEEDFNKKLLKEYRTRKGEKK